MRERKADEIVQIEIQIRHRIYLEDELGAFWRTQLPGRSQVCCTSLPGDSEPLTPISGSFFVTKRKKKGRSGIRPHEKLEFYKL